MSKSKKPHFPAKQNHSQGSESPAPKVTLENSTLREVTREVETRLVAKFQHFSGPLPPPAILEDYERILPGAAARVFTMAEENNNFGIEIDRELVRGQFMERRLAQLGGFILGMTGLVGAIYLGINGFEIAAGSLGGVTLASLVSTFIYGHKKTKSKENSKSS